VNLREGDISIQASIGFSLFPRDGDQIEILLKKADSAMYRVKRNQKNNFSVY
jgi:GGDEF domain-containing protein